MKKNILFSASLLLAGIAFAADSNPKDDVTAATKKLADKANYSWKQTQDLGANSPFQPGPTEGKTQKDGTTWVASTFNDNTSEGFLKGTNVVVKTEEGWKTAAEATGDAGGGGGGGFNPGTFLVRRLQSITVPATEVADLVAKAKELTKDGDTYSGELTAEGATALLSQGFGGRGGRRGPGGPGGQPPAPTNVKGTVKFWLKDGALTKYETKVSGKRQNQNGEETETERTTTIEIKDIGTTKLEVPADAAKKLAATP